MNYSRVPVSPRVLARETLVPTPCSLASARPAVSDNGIVVSLIRNARQLKYLCGSQRCTVAAECMRNRCIKHVKREPEASVAGSRGLRNSATFLRFFQRPSADHNDAAERFTSPRFPTVSSQYTSRSPSTLALSSGNYLQREYLWQIVDLILVTYSFVLSIL